MTRYETTSIAELVRTDGWSPIRLSLEVLACGINAWTAHEPGATVIPAHDERPTGHEDRHDRVRPRSHGHSRSSSGEPATTVLSVGGKPGKAYRPLARETHRDVFALLDRGEYEEAKQFVTDALDRYDDRSTLLYNLGCAEAHLGETDEALEHLRAALAARPSLAEEVRRDADFELLRNDPRFAEIVGAP